MITLFKEWDAQQHTKCVGYLAWSAVVQTFDLGGSHLVA